MPSVRIATGKWVLGSEMRVIEAVQSALVSAFRIPERDRDIVLDVYDENRRIVSIGHSERYTRIEIIGIAARSLDAKRELFRIIADDLKLASVHAWRDPNVPDRPPSESWGIKGGLLTSEMDLGFKVDVQIFRNGTRQ